MGANVKIGPSVDAAKIIMKTKKTAESAGAIENRPAL